MLRRAFYSKLQLFSNVSKISMMASEDLCQTVASNIETIKESIAETVASSTLTERCQLIAVSKTKSSDLIKACISGGQLDFGENYVNELEEKSATLKDEFPNIRWHYIGQVQSNKIPKISNCPGLYAVHTLESEKHCDGFNKEMSKRERTLNVFVQVNTSREEQKGGLIDSAAINLASYIREKCPNLKFIGFMTIGSFDNSHTIPNPDFTALYEVRAKFASLAGISANELELSMGMSDDYVQAIVQGSTSVRVGSKIFGPRIYKK